MINIYYLNYKEYHTSCTDIANNLELQEGSFNLTLHFFLITDSLLLHDELFMM